MTAPYRGAGELREAELRKQGAESLLRAAAAYLEHNRDAAAGPAGRFLIHLMWAADASVDGQRFDIRSQPPGESTTR